MALSSNAVPGYGTLPDKSHTPQDHVQHAQPTLGTIPAVKLNQPTRPMQTDFRVPAPLSEGDPDVLDEERPMKPDAFYKLIGIVPQAADQLSSDDLEAGAGLYHDIRRNQVMMRACHFWLEVMIYTALLLQVVLSAMFIVLGAMRGE